MSQNRYARAIARFDAANAEDPNLELAAGVERPKELLYAERMSAWLERLEPRACEPLRLAARCQHLCRWRIPRREYPDGRKGYLDWRNACKRMHAELAADILREVGYDEATVERVCDLVQKRRLKADSESQLLEDVVCLVFLESYLAGFSVKHDEEKLVAILRKTWRKMSPAGHRAALGLELPESVRRLVERAVG